MSGECRPRAGGPARPAGPDKPPAAGGKLDAYRAQLSSVAQTLADTVNAVHGSPAFFTYTSGSAATTLAAATVAGASAK